LGKIEKEAGRSAAFFAPSVECIAGSVVTEFEDIWTSAENLDREGRWLPRDTTVEALIETLGVLCGRDVGEVVAHTRKEQLTGDRRDILDGEVIEDGAEFDAVAASIEAQVPIERGATRLSRSA
jgi:hypothetical protein